MKKETYILAIVVILGTLVLILGSYLLFNRDELQQKTSVITPTPTYIQDINAEVDLTIKDIDNTLKELDRNEKQNIEFDVKDFE